ncbi:uncharacterized protein METZ01_LOCUS28157, partial [marine metagenome]
VRAETLGGQFWVMTLAEGKGALFYCAGLNFSLILVLACVWISEGLQDLYYS